MLFVDQRNNSYLMLRTMNGQLLTCSFLLVDNLLRLFFRIFQQRTTFLFLHAEVLRQLTTLNGFASATVHQRLT